MCEDQRVKSFKDVLKSDIKQVFLNFEEFGEIHKINGQEVLLIIDENELTEREKRIRHNKEELHRKQLLFYVFARHGRALTGESPEHAQVVGNV